MDIISASDSTLKRGATMSLENKIDPRPILADDVWARIPASREQDSHKGTFGKVLCIAGCSRYRGAASLTIEGALRSGCGIVTLASVEEVFPSVQPRLPECILIACDHDEIGGIAASNLPKLQAELDNGYSALLMGPGMGNTTSTTDLVINMVENADCTVVLDADALNALPQGVMPHPKGGHKVIITPHPGEMARLCNCSIRDIKADRYNIILDYARKHDCIVVLKEHRTLIASPDGQLWINTTGNSGLARGGSGDILAGMMGSFAAQGWDPLDVALCAVWLHGEAAVRCSQRKSQTAMLPHDIFDDLGQIFLERNL